MHSVFLKTYEIGAILLPILHMRKLRHKDDRLPAKRHTAIKWLALAPESVLWPIPLQCPGSLSRQRLSQEFQPTRSLCCLNCTVSSIRNILWFVTLGRLRELYRLVFLLGYYFPWLIVVSGSLWWGWRRGSLGNQGLGEQWHMSLRCEINWQEGTGPCLQG